MNECMSGMTYYNGKDRCGVRSLFNSLKAVWSQANYTLSFNFSIFYKLDTAKSNLQMVADKWNTVWVFWT